MNRQMAILVLVLSVGAIGQLISAEVKKDAPKLEFCSCFQTNAIHEFDGVFLAGQPSPEGFVEAQKAGVRTVVNLRAGDELNWDEKAHVEGLGLRYVQIPIASADAMTDDVFVQMRGLLKDKSKRPMLVHCFSAGRVGATWLAHRVLDDGLSVEAALQEAKKIGLNKEDYIRKATDYVQRMKAKPEKS